MLKKVLSILILMVSMLAACSSPSTGDAVNGSVTSGNSTQEGTTQSRLKEDYSDALSIQGQLAAGTILLEDGDLAVDETAAAELLPLWQALESLAGSDTAAPAEITAVLDQIQDTMTPAQITAISDMTLTEDSLTDIFESGALRFGPGAALAAADGSDNGAAGGFPGGGFAGGGPGGFPGGGFAGGGLPPGGFEGGPPGGLGDVQGLDPDAIATRQAEFAADGGAGFQERALLGAVVRLLGTKTGEFSGEDPGAIFETVFTLVSEETGLSVEEIQTALAGGTTMAELLEAHGGDVEAIRQALIEAFSGMPNADGLDLEQMAGQWLGLEE